MCELSSLLLSRGYGSFSPAKALSTAMIVSSPKAYGIRDFM